MVRRFLLMLTLLTSAMGGVAEAYLLPAEMVVEKASQVLEKLSGSELNFEGTLQGDGRPEPIKARWSFAPKSRILVEDQAGRKASWPLGTEQTRESDQLLPHNTILQILDGLFGRADLKTLMLKHQIDVTQQRLVLHDRTVSHVIGARLPASANSQIWVDQTTFVITRVRLRTAGQDIELELNDWNGPISKGQFPHVIVVRIDGRERERMRLTRFRGKGD